MRVYNVLDGESWWIVANDLEDALVVCKTLDIGVDDDFEGLEIREADPNEVLSVSLVGI